MKDDEKNKYLIFALTAFATVILDQATKLIFLSTGSFNIFPILSITLVKNTGASFGILKGKTPLLILVSFVVIFLIFYMRKHLAECRETEISLSLILGGTVGNLIDRIFRGGVIDFIHLHYMGLSYPTFNIADSCIVAGTLILAWTFLRKNEKDKMTGKNRKVKTHSS